MPCNCGTASHGYSQDEYLAKSSDFGYIKYNDSNDYFFIPDKKSKMVSNSRKLKKVETYQPVTYNTDIVHHSCSHECEEKKDVKISNMYDDTNRGSNFNCDFESIIKNILQIIIPKTESHGELSNKGNYVKDPTFIPKSAVVIHENKITGDVKLNTRVVDASNKISNRENKIVPVIADRNVSSKIAAIKIENKSKSTIKIAGRSSRTFRFDEIKKENKSLAKHFHI